VYTKLNCHSSVLIRVLAKLCHCEIVSALTKYDIQCLDVSVGLINIIVCRRHLLIVFVLSRFVLYTVNLINYCVCGKISADTAVNI